MPPNMVIAKVFFLSPFLPPALSAKNLIRYSHKPRQANLDVVVVLQKFSRKYLMHPLLFANEASELYLQYSSKKDTSELKLIGLQLIFAFLFRCGKRRIKKGGVWQ
jgi:hypothetical protein